MMLAHELLEQLPPALMRLEIFRGRWSTMLAHELIEQLPLALCAARDLPRPLEHDACA